MSEMLVTYFPSVLLMAITFATTFFKPFFFEAGLSVNLTTMLVMTTIFISVMEKLPLTSYPKMIDFWLIFCQVGKVFCSKTYLSQLVPFAEVVLLTAMEYCREGKFNEQHLHSKYNQIHLLQADSNNEERDATTATPITMLTSNGHQEPIKAIG